MTNEIEDQECAYCGAMVPGEDEGDAVPEVGDDEAWKREAKHHADDCEWIKTRAHRVNFGRTEEIERRALEVAAGSGVSPSPEITHRLWLRDTILGGASTNCGEFYAVIVSPVRLTENDAEVTCPKCRNNGIEPSPEATVCPYCREAYEVDEGHACPPVWVYETGDTPEGGEVSDAYEAGDNPEGDALIKSALSRLGARWL